MNTAVTSESAEQKEQGASSSSSEQQEEEQERQPEMALNWEPQDCTVMTTEQQIAFTSQARKTGDGGVTHGRMSMEFDGTVNACHYRVRSDYIHTYIYYIYLPIFNFLMIFGKNLKFLFENVTELVKLK